MKQKNTSRWLIGILALCMLISMVACKEEPSNTVPATGNSLWDGATYRENAEVGQGKTRFELQVTAGDKSIVLTVRTDKTNLAEALLEYRLVEGDDGAYGLYVKKVIGITADYDVDQSWWGLNQNGEPMMSGVSGVTVAEGARYELIYSK